MAAIAVVDGIIYVIGGQSGALFVIHSDVEAYDPATDMWTRKADMPTARYWHAACVVDGQIYVSGGSPKWGEGLSLTTVEVYDPATDTWTQASDMPRSRISHTASVVAGKMHIIGGADLERGKNVLTVDVYDPATDTWATATDHPTAIDTHTAAVVDGKIYTIGGSWGPPGPEAPVLSTVYEYDPGLSDNITVNSPAGKLLRTWGEVKSE
jgi:N-acetylneuraminic acid mutarotase